MIHEYAPKKSILGVCLGEQAIGEAFGAKLTNLSKVFHGVQTPVKILHDQDDYLFKVLPDWIPAVRPLVGIPILRKDFIIDPFQLYEARLAGSECSWTKATT